MAKKLNIQEEKDIGYRYLQGESSVDIAKDFPVSDRHIRYTLKVCGIVRYVVSLCAINLWLRD